MIDCFITPVHGSYGFHRTFIYGFNDREKSEVLWDHSKKVSVSTPWIICGDFNCVMNTYERIGSHVKESVMRALKNCVMQCGLQDIKSSGNFYTCIISRKRDARVFSKLDRMLANLTWQELYPSAKATFHNEGEFDHSPKVLLVIP